MKPRELFQRAIGLLEPHEARPGDTDTQELIDSCRRCLALPGFEKNFRQRTQEAWAAFAGIEPELRRIMDTDEMRERGEELVEECQKVLELAFCSPSFELGVGGEKYELILSADGNRSALFPLVYFQRRAPESVLEHWNILVGRQPSAGFSLQAGAGVCAGALEYPGGTSALSGIFSPGRGTPGAGGGRAGLDRAQGGPGFPDSLL